MLLAIALSLAAGVDEDLAGALMEPGCPRLWARYASEMQAAYPQSMTAAFCDGLRANGRLVSLRNLGREGAWTVVELKLQSATFFMRYDVTAAGRLAGFRVDAEPPVRDVSKPMRWPVDGAGTLVFWGGDVAADNYHVAHPRQRRAVDIVCVDDGGKRFRTDGKENADYYCYRRRVRAAASGTVIVVIDGVPENVPGVMNPDVVPGNLVVVDQGNNEYAHYCHLVPHALSVKVGDRVNAGDVLGLLGNSGNSSEPHLHFHVQDARDIAQGLGLAPYFVDVTVARGGKPFATTVYRPRKGDIVRTR